MFYFLITIIYLLRKKYQHEWPKYLFNPCLYVKSVQLAKKYGNCCIQELV